MKQVKVTSIKGSCVYSFKGKLHINRPSKTYTKKLLYNEESNMTVVYVGRNYHIIEVLCCIIMIISIVIYLTSLPLDKEYVNYNSVANYTNNELYINIANNTNMRVRCALWDDTSIIDARELEPNECWIKINIEEPASKYTINITNINSIFKFKKRSTISVMEVDSNVY